LGAKRPYVCLVVPELSPESNVAAFFEDAVRGAADSRGYDPEAGTTRYVVGLLSDYAKPDGFRGEALLRPLTILYGEALEADGPERFQKLRALGDDALYLCGFFPDHLERRGVEQSFVMRMGEAAYVTLSSLLRRGRRGPSEPDIFDRLASDFEPLVTVLGDVADAVYAASAREPRAVLDLYERWVRRGSPAMAEALLRNGVVPVRGGGTVH
jgi:hypothetical protein